MSPYGNKSRIVLLGATSDQLASSLLAVGIPLLSFTTVGDLTATSILLVVSNLPRLVVGPYAGVLAERMNRRHLAIGAGSARAALLLLAPLIYQLWGLIGLGAVLFLTSVAGAILQPALASSLPLLFGADYKKFLSSRSGLIFTAQTLGPILAAGLASFVGMGTILLSAGVLASISLVATASIRDLDSRTAEDRNIARAEGTWASMVSGMKYAGQNKVVGGMLIYWTLSIAAVPLATLPILPYITSTLMVDPAGFGIATSVYAFGCVVGSIAMRWVDARGRIRPWLLASGLIYSCVCLAILAHPSFIVLVVLWLIWGLAYGPEEVFSQLLFAEAADAKFLGRIYSFMAIAFTMGSLVGYAIAGPLSDSLGPVLTVSIGGIVFLASTIGTFAVGPVSRAVKAHDAKALRESHAAREH